MYSHQGRNHTGSYQYTHRTKDGDVYSFISIDMCPRPGLARPFNVVGRVTDVRSDFNLRVSQCLCRTNCDGSRHYPNKQKIQRLESTSVTTRYPSVTSTSWDASWATVSSFSMVTYIREGKTFTLGMPINCLRFISAIGWKNESSDCWRSMPASYPSKTCVTGIESLPWSPIRKRRSSKHCVNRCTDWKRVHIFGEWEVTDHRRSSLSFLVAF